MIQFQFFFLQLLFYALALIHAAAPLLARYLEHIETMPSESPLFFGMCEPQTSFYKCRWPKPHPHWICLTLFSLCVSRLSRASAWPLLLFLLVATRQLCHPGSTRKAAILAATQTTGTKISTNCASRQCNKTVVVLHRQ